MAKYPLEELIGLRERRKERALTHKKQQELLLEQRLQEEADKQRELTAYAAFREAEIGRRYAELLKRTADVNELGEFNAGILALYAAELTLQRELTERRQEVQAQRRAAEEAAAQAQQLTKAVQKLESHRSLWQLQQRLLEERQADAELEDFRVKRPETADF